MTVVNIQEAKTNLSKLLVLAEQGEQVFIARRGETIVQLVHTPKQKTRKLGVLPGHISDAGLAPLDEDEIAAWENV